MRLSNLVSEGAFVLNLKTLIAVSNDEFPARLKQALLSTDRKMIPLHMGTSMGGAIEADNMDVSVLTYTELVDRRQAKVAFFFAEIMPGCSCGFEAEPQPAYCEFLLSIDKVSGDVNFSLSDTL